MLNYSIIFISIYLLLKPLTGFTAAVLEVQEMLNTLGYEVGIVDGKWGAKSREALKQFQIDKGLTVTGKINAETEQALQISIKPPAPVEPIEIAKPVATPVITVPSISETTAKLMPLKSSSVESKSGIKFVRIQGGCFTMGGGNFPIHDVCVHEGNSFLISQYEITQGQWKAIIGSNPSIHVVGDNYPVENVSWNDVQIFIDKLNKLGQGKYRLPTEAEWEYSARANTKTMYWWGDKEPICKPGSPNSANFNGDKECSNTTVKVGTYQPNAFDLYDVHGNVWEWVEDVYLPDAYTRHQKHDPIITEGSTERVFRGGSWLYPASAMTVFNRDHAAPNFQFSHLGFRLIYE